MAKHWEIVINISSWEMREDTKENEDKTHLG
jgi:hypothetical protein